MLLSFGACIIRKQVWGYGFILQLVFHLRHPESLYSSFDMLLSLVWSPSWGFSSSLLQLIPMGLTNISAFLSLKVKWTGNSHIVKSTCMQKCVISVWKWRIIMTSKYIYKIKQHRKCKTKNHDPLQFEINPLNSSEYMQKT